VSIGAATEKDNIKILLLGNEVLSLKNGRLTIKVEKAANGLNRLDISTIPEPEFNALIVSQNTTLTTWHERLRHIASKTVQTHHPGTL
jgi:phosphopantetheine adenylyltransferase